MAEFSWTSWHGDLTLRLGIGLLVLLYFAGIGPIRRRYRLANRVERGRVLKFVAGVAILFLALEGPLHDLSDNYLFSAHMTQHMMLTLFVPPLLIMGTPGWLLRPLIRNRIVYRAAAFVTAPLVALLIFNVPFTASHVPLFYQQTLENHAIHVMEHLIFIALAVVTWWPLLSPLPELPRLSYPIQLLYVFAQTFSGFIIGAFLANATRPLYAFYVDAPRVLGMSALDDQRVGGLLMWIGGGVYFLLIFTAIFFAWAHAEGVHDDVAPPPVPIQPRTPMESLGPQHVVATGRENVSVN